MLRPIVRLTRFLVWDEMGVWVGVMVVDVEEEATGVTFHADVRD